MLALMLCAAPAAGPADAQESRSEIDTLALSAHTRFLASDLLAGRGTGSAGERIAALYIQAQLERLGLRPGGSDESFLLPVPLRSVTILPTSEIVVTTHGESTSFATGRDFVLNTGGAGAFRDFSGSAIFLGDPGAAPPRLRAMQSLEGRVAVFTGQLGAAASDIVPNLIRLGAAAVILLAPDPASFDLYRRSRGESRFHAEGDVQDPVWQPALPVVIAGPALSRALLPRPGATVAADVAAHIETTVEPVAAANVAGWIEGADPRRRDEFVVYTAHYDHLGVSTPDAAGDSIYNGFSDNAAGVAMLLGIAATMIDDPPARSVAFLFLTGEERGLLGSSWLAAAPPAWLPLQHVVGLVNLDAGAPPAPPLSWRIAGGEGTALGELARGIAADNGWDVTLSAASPNSDYWPFLQHGVPSIFIIPGDVWENTSPAQRDDLRRRWDRYHMPGDHWHPDFPFSGLQRYAEFARQLGRTLADDPTAGSPPDAARPRAMSAGPRDKPES